MTLAQFIKKNINEKKIDNTNIRADKMKEFYEEQLNEYNRDETHVEKLI